MDDATARLSPDCLFVRRYDRSFLIILILTSLSVQTGLCYRRGPYIIRINNVTVSISIMKTILDIIFVTKVAAMRFLERSGQREAIVNGNDAVFIPLFQTT